MKGIEIDEEICKIFCTLCLCMCFCNFGIVCFFAFGSNFKKSEFDRLKSTYISLKSKTNEKNSLTSDEYAEYASLFDAISHGDKEMTSDYAQLVREITDNTVDFEDDVPVLAGMGQNYIGAEGYNSVYEFVPRVTARYAFAGGK